MKLEEIDREIAAAEQQLKRKREDLKDFEVAIATLKQPVAASIGTSPTETMIQIVGDAATQKERDQRLKDAQLAANKHREEIIKLENSLSKLKEQKKVTEKQLIWEEIYEPHSERLRADWNRPAQIENKILKNLALMEQSREEVEKHKKRLDGWEQEKKRIEQVEGYKTDPNFREHLQGQIAQAEAAFNRCYNEISRLENQEEERLFRTFVVDRVDYENALNDLKPHIQKLQRLNLQYRKQADDLQAKIEQHIAVRYIKVQIPELPEEFGYEFK